MKCWSVTLMFVVSAALAQTPCEQLRSLSLPGVAITAAEFVPEKPLDAGGAAGQVRTTLPPHCRVAAVLTPSSDSHIEMEIWLPPAGSWNGKYQAVGNGGWAGSITFGTGVPQPVGRTMVSALKERYATSSCDTSHKATPDGAAFALGLPGARERRDMLYQGAGHCQRSVLRYFRPESHSSTATVSPRCGPRSSSRAAATFAPEEKPANSPSSRASRRAVSIAD